MLVEGRPRCAYADPSRGYGLHRLRGTRFLFETLRFLEYWPFRFMFKNALGDIVDQIQGPPTLIRPEELTESQGGFG